MHFSVKTNHNWPFDAKGFCFTCQKTKTVTTKGIKGSFVITIYEWTGGFSEWTNFFPRSKRELLKLIKMKTSEYKSTCKKVLSSSTINYNNAIINWSDITAVVFHTIPLSASIQLKLVFCLCSCPARLLFCFYLFFNVSFF